MYEAVLFGIHGIYDGKRQWYDDAVYTEQEARDLADKAIRAGFMFVEVKILRFINATV